MINLLGNIRFLYESDKAKITYVSLKLEFLNENNVNSLNVFNLL